MTRLFSFLLIICSVLSVYGNQPFVIDDNRSPVISEFMAVNDETIMDAEGDYSDWIELYNPYEDTILLSGWYLSDNPLVLTKWEFPDFTIAPGNFLLLFASGKDTVYGNSEIHTSFKLNDKNESLYLTKPDGDTVAWRFFGAYPLQYSDVSYGIADTIYTYLHDPTPGFENILRKFVPPPVIGLPHGYYDDTISISISSLIPGARILYTLDNSAPLEGTETEYTGVLHFDSTVIIRAIAILDGVDTSEIITCSYIFPEFVIHQPIVPNGYPEMWGPNTAYWGNAWADYEMDPDVVNSPEYRDSMILSLNSIPVISVVTKTSNLFSDEIDFETGGIYMYTGAPITDFTYDTGRYWQRPASVEYFEPGGTGSFQVNCGIKINGGHSRRPEKCPKHSLRLLFKKEFGPSRFTYDLYNDDDAVKNFNRLILRGGFNNTWHHSSTDQRNRSQFIHDSWAKDTQQAMGHVSAHNKFSHLYLNGLYWGLYNISERIDDEFMQSYYGGNDEDYDVIKDYTEPLKGNLDAFNELSDLLQQDVSTDSVYQKILGNNPDGTANPSFPAYVDPLNLIDYMLINFYGGNTDWDHHNWAIGRNRVEPGTGFKFFIWDAEHIFEGINHDVTDEFNWGCPSSIFQILTANDDFKLMLEERIRMHFYNNGLLTPHSAMARWEKRAEEVRLAVMSESARWGDYRRSDAPYTLHNDWDREYNNLMENYFPYRTQRVIQQLRNRGLFPTIEPPVFSHESGYVEMNYELTLYSGLGTIYYTTDGSDPRLYDGSYSESAQIYIPGEALVLDSTTIINARVQYNSEWSAVVQGNYYILDPVGIDGYQISFVTNEVSIYPNPTEDVAFLKLCLKQNSNIEVDIFNSGGQFVQHVYSGHQNKGWEVYELNASSLPKGIYFIRINGMDVLYKKFIKK